MDFQATYAAVTEGTRNPAPQVAARVTQLSKTGLRLRTKDELPIGVWVEITYQDERDGRRSQTRLQARVVRALPGFRPDFEYGMLKRDADA